MKIDTDLRLAIKAAANAQPQSDWRAEEDANRAAIADLFRRKPVIAATVRKLAARIKKAEQEEQEARQQLCEKFGLRTDGPDTFTFSQCGEGGKKTFQKAGGVLPQKFVRWNYDTVMTELAKATPAEGAAILKRLGINWQ